MADDWYMLQDLNQVLQAELCGSTGAVGQFGQADFLAHHLGFLLVLFPVVSRCYSGCYHDQRD